MKIKRVLVILLLAGVMFCAGFGTLALIIRPQPLQMKNISLEQIEDGAYIGVCQNKILFAVVDVWVRDHTIADIQVVWHKASYLEQARAIAALVVNRQTLDVDAVSGATLTCDTVRGAIQNALEQKPLFQANRKQAQD